MDERVSIVSADTKRPTRATHLKTEVLYSLGGFSHATHQIAPRGYYLHVTPVTRREYGGGIMWESVSLNAAFKSLALQCKRRSPKNEAQAIALAKGQRDNLIQRCLKENGFMLAGEGAAYAHRKIEEVNAQ